MRITYMGGKDKPQFYGDLEPGQVFHFADSLNHTPFLFTSQIDVKGRSVCVALEDGSTSGWASDTPVVLIDGAFVIGA